MLLGGLWLQNLLSAQNRIIRSNLKNTVKYVINTIRRIIRLRRMTHPWVPHFFKPNNQTASEKKAVEGESSQGTCRTCCTGQGSTGRVGCSSKKEETRGRPHKLASGISGRGAGPLLGRKDTKRKGAFYHFTFARTHTHTRTRTHTTRTHKYTTHAHIYVHNCMHTHAHNTRTRTHANMRMHAHVRAHTRACIRMHVQLKEPKALT